MPIIYGMPAVTGREIIRRIEHSSDAEKLGEFIAGRQIVRKSKRASRAFSSVDPLKKFARFDRVTCNFANYRRFGGSIRTRKMVLKAIEAVIKTVWLASEIRTRRSDSATVLTG